MLEGIWQVSELEKTFSEYSSAEFSLMKMFCIARLMSLKSKNREATFARCAQESLMLLNFMAFYMELE